MLTVNNHPYFVWDRLISQKDKWIGGLVFDQGNYMDDDRRGDFNYKRPEQTGAIKDLKLEPSGKELAKFTVEAEGFSITEEISVLSIDVKTKPGTIMFAGFGGHKFEITPKAGEKFSFRLFED